MIMTLLWVQLGAFHCALQLMSVVSTPTQRTLLSHTFSGKKNTVDGGLTYNMFDNILESPFTLSKHKKIHIAQH